MPRRGGEARSVFQGRGLHEAEAVEEVDPLRMIDDDLRAPERLEGLCPSSHRLVQLIEERLPVALERRSAVSGEAREPLENVLRNRRGEPGIERVVGVPERMHVAHRAVYPHGWDFQDRQPPGAVDATRRATHDVRTVRA